MEQLTPGHELDYLLKKETSERNEEENAILQLLLEAKESMDDLDKKQKERAFKMGMPLRHSYYDMDCNPISMWDWHNISLSENKHIGLDQIGPYEVSTVWLGINHAYLDGSPIIFETMIFANIELQEDDELISYQERYSTKEQAIEGHQRACQLCREKI